MPGGGDHGADGCVGTPACLHSHPQLDGVAFSSTDTVSFLLIGLEGKTILDRKTLWVALIQKKLPSPAP